MDMIMTVEKEFMRKKTANISIGDLVEVLTNIAEGDKERTQKFIGTVIAKKGSGVRANFTVRRIVQGEGVERTFPIHSPNLKGVNIVKSNKVRRAKLYYLRNKKGKAASLKERFIYKTTGPKVIAKVKEKTQVSEEGVSKG